MYLLIKGVLIQNSRVNTIKEAAELFNSIDKDKYAIVFYNVIVGMQGQKPIIKRINIEIQDI